MSLLRKSKRTAEKKNRDAELMRRKIDSLRRAMSEVGLVSIRTQADLGDGVYFIVEAEFAVELDEAMSGVRH